MVLPRAYPHPFPATRRLSLVLVALLAIHVVLAWLALQSALAFVELAWRAVAGREEYRPLLVTHVSQFRALRVIQLALWLVTAAIFAGWVSRMRRLLALRELWSTSSPARRRWWLSLLVSAMAVETVTRGLALRSGQPLDLGPGMQILILGELLTGAAAIVGITVVLGIQSRLEAPWRQAREISL